MHHFLTWLLYTRDKFDLRSFFALHDLDRNGVWTRPEIEAVYGVHHIFSQKMSADDKAHQEKADKIVVAVLQKMDTNKDGMVSVEEFEKAGLAGLPDFSSLGAEGHHYAEESEFLYVFLTFIPMVPCLTLLVF